MINHPTMLNPILTRLAAQWHYYPLVLIAGLILSLSQSTPISAQSPLITHKIRYYAPEVGQVIFVWGINDWSPVAEDIRPPGTIIEADGLMYTPMTAQGYSFLTTITLPKDSELNYAFLITQTRDGEELFVWDEQEPIDAVADGKIINYQRVSQEIRYYNPKAESVTLVWGVDGWSQVAESLRPPDTTIENNVMNTPMVRQGDTFLTKVNVPLAATIDHGFWVTELDDTGETTSSWQASEDYALVAGPASVFGVNAGVLTAEPPLPFSNVFDVVVYLVVGLIIVIGVSFILWHIPPENQRLVGTTLIGLMLLGFLLRLWAVWNVNLGLPDTSLRLTARELGFDELAYSFSSLNFIPLADRPPLYPLFLSILYLIFGQSYALIFYVQAFIGVLVIPLTFSLAEPFTKTGPALAAAALTALHPALISQSTTLSNEILFTPLLLLSLLSFMQSVESQLVSDFWVTGIIFALTFLCQPTVALLPLILLPLIPYSLQDRSLKLKSFGALVGPALGLGLLWAGATYLAYDTFLSWQLVALPFWQGSPAFFYFMDDWTPWTQIWDWQLNPANNGAHDPNTVAGGRYFFYNALEAIFADPGTYFNYLVLKPVFFWWGHPTFDWPNYSFFSVQSLRPYTSPIIIAATFLTGLLPLLAAIGIWILYEIRKYGSDLMPLFIFCLYFTLVHLFMYPELRFSVPLHPILLTIIISALHREYK